ncbi:MAG: DUF6797 domain-containing protein [Planctomycetota bacterium]
MRSVCRSVVLVGCVVSSLFFSGFSKAADAEKVSGLVGEYFQAPNTLGDFMKLDAASKPTYVRVDANIAFGDTGDDFYGIRMSSNFHARWTGFIRIEKDGKYEFATRSDDGSRLFIDDKEVVKNYGTHPPTLAAGSVELKAGDHAIKVEFFQGTGGAECVVGWKVPGGKMETIPGKSLFHAKDAEKIPYDEAAWKKRPEGKKEVAGNAKISGGGGGGGGGNNQIHEKMDYGAFLSGSIESSYPSGGNYALKGLAIRVGDKKQAAVSFDTEMLRYSVCWTGDYLDLNYGRDGLEGHPKVKGTPVIGTKGTSIGWANPATGEFGVKAADGKLDDPRAKATGTNRPEGPLPREWAKYKGVYVDGYKAILHYTVGDCDILEQPSFDDSDAIGVFVRSISAGTSSKPLTAVLFEDDKAEATSSATKTSAELDCKDYSILAALVGAPEGSTLAIDAKRVVLKLPALTAPAKFTIKIANVKKDDKAKFTANAKVPTVEFDGVTKNGGASRWKPIVTKGETAESRALKEDKKAKAAPLIAEAKKALKADQKWTVEDDDRIYAGIKLTADVEAKALASVGAYAVDKVYVPFENDFSAYMRLTGVDFFKDGRAAVCTMSGDVWIVSGIDKDLNKVTWQRFATGLFASLGLRIVDDQIYTIGRDQITRFYDYNKDGEADYYESFNNDCTVGPDYHEFAHDLHTDTKGDFYYMKGSNLGADGGKYHGTMVKVSKDGSTSEVFAVGFRAPNGMCVGPNDEITTGDNQGNWTPSSPVNWVKKGGFYGHQEKSWPDSFKGPRSNPLCWIPYEEDNSCGGQVWGGANWGPLSNRLLHMSYGKCKLFSVVIEKYGDDVQGGVVKLPLEFSSGMMRGRVNPTDGQIYLAGMRGWQTSAPETGGLHRIRYTGKPYNAPMEAKIANNSITITFNEKLDPASVQDASNWDVRRFNVKYTSGYGSDEYSLIDETKKHRCGDHASRDVVEVKSVKLDADGKTVKVELADVKLCTNMVIRYKIEGADGSKIKQELDYTVNFIPGGEKSPGMFPPEPKKKEETKKDEKKK